MSTVREATYELLRTLGLTTVFGNPGSTEQTFLQDFPSDFTFVLGLQEASVVGMADGYAQATGKPALVQLHTAAGLGNAMGQVMEAWSSKVPLIITAGNQTREWILREPYLTNLAPEVLAQPFVKWSYEPKRSEDIPGAIMRAYITAVHPPAGPVFLSFPFGDFNEQAGKPVSVRQTVQRVEPDADALRKCADILSQSRHPILFIGAGLGRSLGGWDAGIKLAEKLHAPVWATPYSERVSFPESHAQYQGILPAALKPAGELLKGHDVALVVGAAAFRFYPYIPGEFPPPETRILVVSDDPREIEISLEGDGLLGDAGIACSRLADAIQRETADISFPEKPPPAQPVATTPITSDFLYSTLAQVKSADAILVDESPSDIGILKQYLLTTLPNSFITEHSGCLGFGLPAAAGIALAQMHNGENRRVIAVIGDGAFQYSIQALYTMAQHHLPVTVIVPHNAEYAILKAFAELTNTPNVPGLDLPGLDIISQARGFGVEAVSVADPHELKQVLQDALTRKGPMVVDVVISRVIPPLV
ncbi:MAG: benzoylformate decarboxylase [Ktedonobacteraceae bacterium]|nr:benzoylformate decarboxylase [Ktedonobacteraceae bacterium]